MVRSLGRGKLILCGLGMGNCQGIFDGLGLEMGKVAAHPGPPASGLAYMRTLRLKSIYATFGALALLKKKIGCT
jgi:hypothetical protein